MSLPLLAATIPFLAEIVAILVVGVVVAYICLKLRLVPIAGFLLAGVLIGPHALAVVPEGELVTALAEIGVVLLLFTIGVEFDLATLARLGRSIVIGGGLQVGVTVAVVAGVAVLAGVGVGAALFTGFLLALSSTAIVLALLAERAETGTPAGRLTLAILIFQDLAIVAMVLLTPLLGGAGGSPLAAVVSLAGALGLVALILVLARKIVPWLLERVAATRRPELFGLAVVAVLFGTAWVTSLAGVSLALGAFLAGLVVSESRYADHALSEVLPFRTVFNAVFFVSIGMLLDLGFFLSNLPLLLATAAGVLVLKAVIAGGSVLVLGYPLRLAAPVGLALAQIGEFSFVLERAGAAVGLSPAGLGTVGAQTFIAVTVMLMLVTPFTLAAGRRLGARLFERAGEIPPAAEEAEDHVEDHVLVVGYGPAGQRLVQTLVGTGIPFRILELNPQLADLAAEDDLPVLRGDATRPLLLEHAGVRRAKLCVIAINDPDAARRIVEHARHLNPTLQIVVRARFLTDVEPLQAAGADIVVPAELETAVRLFTHVLQAYNIPRDEIDRHVTAIRSGDYRVFRSRLHEAHLMVLQGLDEEGLHTRAVVVRPGAPVAGRTLEDLALRRTHGLTVLAIRRGDRTLGNPAGDFMLQEGDRLVLVGTASRFADAADLFRTLRTDGEVIVVDAPPTEGGS